MQWYLLVGMREARADTPLTLGSTMSPDRTPADLVLPQQVVRVWYVGDSPHLTCERTGETGKVGENGQSSWQVSKDLHGSDRRLRNWM